MMNTYTELLEQIVIEMKSTLLGGNSVVIDSEYRQWLDFLRQVKPESEVLKNISEQQVALVENARDDPPNNGLKVYSDLREIIRFAATNNHPTWYIQPHYTDLETQLSYENEELQNAVAINGIPKNISGFSGTIHGAWLSEQVFIAHDVDSKTGFVKKMELLQNAGFVTPDFALFQTDKLLTVSVSKLEMSLMNFISTAREKWAQVDGAVIISDTPLFADSNRLIFKPHNQFTTV